MVTIGQWFGTVFGRDPVLGEAWQVLTRGGVVLLEGPAGIGKTAVWRCLLSRAEAAGWLVLSCAPAELETVLPYAALADLLAPLVDAIPDLPAPQRNAAEAVLLRDRIDRDWTTPVDERVVGSATRSLIEAAMTGGGGRRPVLVAIDDSQWLDRPSERAIRFVLRRVAAVATLVTSRTGEPADPGEAPLGLDRAPAVSGGINRIALAPLGVGALHHVLRRHLDATLSRPLLARIARDSGGNPLLAIELARAVLRLPKLPGVGEDLPVVPSMQALLDDAFAALPPPDRAAVRLASLLAVPALRDLDAAGVPAAAFEAAEEAGLLTVTPTRVEFAHPVYAAAVRAGIPAGVRRRLHRRLAEVVTEPDERARHLARCTVDPDGQVAAELSRAAERLRLRGAPTLAADLYQRAADLTPPSDASGRARRRLAAVQCLIDSGDYQAAAEAIASDTAAGVTGDILAEALLLRAVIAWYADEPGQVAVTAAEGALELAPHGSALAGRVHAYLSAFSDAPEPARRHAESAIALLTERGGDRQLLAGAHSIQHLSELRLGWPARPELLDRALALEGDEPSWFAGTVPAICWKATDDHERARARLYRLLDLAAARGDEPLQHELLGHLGETELLAGRWASAEEHIAAALDLGEQLGTGLVGERWLAGLLAALRGRLDEARPIADAGLHLAGSTGDPWCRRIHLQLAGFVALSAGRMDEAATAYGRLAEAVDEIGLIEPLPLRFEPDWVEACVAAGRLNEAAAAMDRLMQRHQRLPRPWTLLGVARAKVLLTSTAGADSGSAVDELIAAWDSVPATVLPFDRARCLLVAGMAQRRARRKRAAREALTQAITDFAVLGAAAFAERARAELHRVAAPAANHLELTATEERVARLAAQGRTNRAIADALFISPKTVEANLARVYRKLGISSRAELGAVMVGR